MHKYLVVYTDSVGKKVEAVIQSSQVTLTDSIEDSLMSFTYKGRITLAIPFRSFVSSTLIASRPVSSVKPA